MLPQNSDQTNLSADVPPFVPRKECQNERSIQDPSGAAPLPRYVTTCYPFVQEQQDGRWPVQQVGSFFVPQAGYSGTSSNIAPVPAASHNPVIVRMIPSSISNFAGQVEDVRTLLHAETVQNPSYNLQTSSTHHKARASERQTGKKVTQRNVGVQKEAIMRAPETRKENPVMVDNSQQTDFPLSIACKSLTDRPSSLKKVNRTRRRRTSAFAEEHYDSSSDHADVDSDSGYYSPKHRLVHKKSGGTSTIELTSGFQPVQQASESQTAVPQVVYLAAPPALYQVQQAGSSRVMAGMLSPHTTPPPPAGFSAAPMFLTPPATPLMSHPGSLGGAGPPHGYPPPNFVKSSNPLQVPGTFVWHAQPRFPAYGPHPRLSSHQYPYKSSTGPPVHSVRPTRQQNSSHGARKSDQQQSSSYMNPGDKRRYNRRKVPEELPSAGLSNRQQRASGPSGDSRSPQLQDGTSLLLSDTQEFPGLGSSSVVNPSMIVGGLLSYSDAVLGKTLVTPSPQTSAQHYQANAPGVSHDNVPMQDKAQQQKNRKRLKKAERASKAADEEYAEISKEQENLKKALRKTAANRNRSKTSVLDLGEIVSKLESKAAASNEDRQDAGKSTSSQGAGTAAKLDGPVSASPRAAGPANPLDSTAPAVKRGKERENPKPKKPSALKKVILKEREEKKEYRIKQLTTYDIPDTDVPPYPPAILDTLKSQSADSADNAVDVDSSLLTAISSSVPQIHSRKYREYCSQVLDKKIDETCTIVLQKLVQFQDRLYQKDPMKAKMRRRLVMGIREVTKHLKLKKLKCVIISPNLEKIQSKGGLDDALQQILNMCEEQNVTYVFALGRRAMGRAVSKLVPVSIVGIFDYSGVEDHYKSMCELVVDAQNKYKEMVSIYQQEVIETSNKTPPVQISSGAHSSKRFAHMGHSRNPSAASCISFASFISEPISEMNEGSNWRVLMDATDEQSTLSPPPEGDSSDEDAAPSELTNQNRTNHDRLSRNNSGSTVVECGRDASLARHGQSNATEAEEKAGDDLPSNLSSGNEDKNSSKILDRSNTSTLAATADKSDLAAPPVNPPSEGTPVIEGLASGTQDRIQLWLEDASRSVQQMTLADNDSDADSVSSQNLSEKQSLSGEGEEDQEEEEEEEEEEEKDEEI